jgi:hypothetical protein
MADIQAQFEKFHDTIRVDFDMSTDLRDSRDVVLNLIRKHLKDNQRPAFRELHQGSYKMKTGVKPLADRDYDIDIGLRFFVDFKEYDASIVRGWVFDAVKDHTNVCKNGGPCVRVVYQAGYHLDLVTYAVEDQAGTDRYRLAHKTNGWRDADPPSLLDHVNAARKQFEGTEDGATQTDQFRRIVRYLRRWDDVHNPDEGDSKPTGLAFVLMCCSHLAPQWFIDRRPDDRAALEQLCWLMSAYPGRIVANKPTPEYEDMFGRLSDADMNALKQRFASLAEALRQAGATVDPVRACKLLRSQFGDDFPVPTPEDSGKKTKAPAIITSSASA